MYSSSPAWEGRPLSRAADRAVLGSQKAVCAKMPAEVRLGKTLRPHDLLPSTENGHQKASAGAETVESPSSIDAVDKCFAMLDGIYEINGVCKADARGSGAPRSSGRRVKVPPHEIPASIGNGSIGVTGHTSPIAREDISNRNGGGINLSESLQEKHTGEVDTACQLTAARVATASDVFEPAIVRDRIVPEDNNQDHTAEQNVERSNVKDSFEEILNKAIRQSDAERAEDRKQEGRSQRVEQSAPLERLYDPLQQPDCTLGPIQSTKIVSADKLANGSDGQPPKQSEGECIANEITVANIDPRLSLALSPTLEAKAVERQWVRYVSPEGYPYLYDEVTGDSEWAVMSEGEEHEEEQDQQQLPKAQEPAGGTLTGAAHGEPVNTHDNLGTQDMNMDPHRAADIKTGGQRFRIHVAENDSVGTCEVSQWSQDTSGPDARNSAGETAMHLAAAQHSLRATSLLLASGANINARDGRGRTPLHAACASFHDNDGCGIDSAIGCIELLLSSGALEDARDAMGQTALHLSALAGNLSAAHALLAAGATVSADDAGNSPLHVAAAQGHSHIIQLLITGSQDESCRKAPASSNFVSRPDSRAPADTGRFHSGFDVDLCPDGKDSTIVPAGIRESESSAAHEVALGYGDSRMHRQTVRPEAHTLGARDEDPQVSRQEDPAYSPCDDAAGTRPSVTNCHSRRRSSSPKSPRCSLVDDGPRREVVHHEAMESPWRRQIDTHSQTSESSARNARKTSEEDSNDHGKFYRLGPDNEHRRQLEGEGIKQRHGRRSRHRRESDRDDRTLRWPEALPAHEYNETMGAIFEGEGDSSRVSSRSALSAALVAAGLASRYDDAAAVIRLLEIQGGGIADVWDDNGRTPLHHACRADNTGFFCLLWRAGADPEAQDRQGNSPLAVAAATGGSACLLLLIQGGSGVNGFNEAGDTPLHLAVRHGNLPCVKALVEGGARLSQRNILGFTPRKDLLNSEPTFTRGRLPKVLRTTLAYIENAEESAAQPHSPTWTARDGYGSEATVVTAASSHHSPVGGHVHDAFDANCNSRASSRRQGSLLQQLDTKRGCKIRTETLHDHRHHKTDRARPTAPERPEHPRDRERWEFQGGENALERRSESGVSSGGSQRGDQNRRERGFDDAHFARDSNSSRFGEAAGALLPNASTSDAGIVPSRIRGGVWSAVGRAIDYLMSIGGGGSQDRSGSEPESDPSDQGDVDTSRHQRPPTDAELRARIPHSLPSQSGCRNSGVGPAGAEVKVTTNLPISLTPMQPPPDVLAAMKGRAAVGRRRPHFATPPADVAAALEKNRASRGHRGPGVQKNAGVVGGTDSSRDSAESISTSSSTSTSCISQSHERRSQQQQENQSQGLRQDLGPFSLSGAGGLGKQGNHAARTMYVKYFEERERMDRTGGM